MHALLTPVDYWFGHPPRLVITPDSDLRTLARRLVKDSKGAITIEQARKRIARQFGVHGVKARKEVKPAAPRQPRQAGEQRAV
jgi:hypothetical protein